MALFKKGPSSQVEKRAEIVIRFESELTHLQMKRKDLLALVFEASDNGDLARVGESKEKVANIDKELNVAEDGITRANQRLVDVIEAEVSHEKKTIDGEVKQYNADFKQAQRDAAETLAVAAFLAEDVQFKTVKEIEDRIFWTRLSGLTEGGVEKELLQMFKRKVSDLRAEDRVTLHERRNLIQQKKHAFTNPSDWECYINRKKFTR